jgi:hypothetical protein
MISKSCGRSGIGARLGVRVRVRRLGGQEVRVRRLGG